MTAPSSFTERGVPKGLVLLATILAGLFLLLGFIVFIGAWSSAKDAVGDDVWVQLAFVGQGAVPYFIAGGLFWLLAEYKTVHGAA
ncbi:MAG: hypothetical protein Q8Q29_10930 [Actinomycetota bacterium]|nr:hypothetical protein [Actinomycetota bacterium]